MITPLTLCDLLIHRLQALWIRELRCVGSANRMIRLDGNITAPIVRAESLPGFSGSELAVLWNAPQHVAR